MKQTLSITVFALLFAGCATWSGIKEDTGTAKEWTKEQINQGASFVKEKTE